MRFGLPFLLGQAALQFGVGDDLAGVAGQLGADALAFGDGDLVLLGGEEII